MRALLLPLLLSAYGVLLPAQGKKCFCGSGSCAETALGTVCGKTEQASSGAGLLPSSMEVDAFYGVRYATIPRRFAPADVANATYPLPYQAIQPAPDCVGNSGVDKPRAGPSPKNHSHQGTIYSEDCLFVSTSSYDANNTKMMNGWLMYHFDTASADVELKNPSSRKAFAKLQSDIADAKQKRRTYRS